MVKKMIVIGIVAMLGSACSSIGKIQMRTDDMTGAKVFTLDLEHTSKERMPGLLAPRYDCIAKYVRDINPKKGEITEVTLVTKACSTCDDLTDNAVLKINDKTYEIKFGEKNTEVKSQTDTTKHYHKRSDGYVDYSRPTGSTSETQTWKELRGKIVITPELKKAMIESSAITYRVYSGTNPVTYVLESDDISKVKKFLLTDGSDLK